eukprot:3139118-Rhodomonas_salina.2
MMRRISSRSSAGSACTPQHTRSARAARKKGERKRGWEERREEGKRPQAVFGHVVRAHWEEGQVAGAELRRPRGKCVFWERGGRDLDFDEVVDVARILQQLLVPLPQPPPRRLCLWRAATSTRVNARLGARCPLARRLGLECNDIVPLALFSSLHPSRSISVQALVNPSSCRNFIDWHAVFQIDAVLFMPVDAVRNTTQGLAYARNMSTFVLNPCSMEGSAALWPIPTRKKRACKATRSMELR